MDTLWETFHIGDLAAAKSLQSCPTLWDPIDGSPLGSAISGILQARTLEWVAISFSNAWKGKVKVKSLSHVQLSVTPWTAAYQALRPWEFPGKSTGVGCHLISVITELGAIVPYWQKRALLPRNRSHVPSFVQLIIKELALKSCLW